MPISRLLEAGKYTPEQIELITKAFNLTLRIMGLVDRNDPLCELVARKVLEAAEAGSGNPKEIAEAAATRIGLR